MLFARSHDLTDARRRLWRILDRCARADVPELLRLGRTLDAWYEELLAYWTPTGRRGVSNGPTEATNALIKKVKRVGHGFRNFDNYRLRLHLPSVWTGAACTGRLRLPPRSEDVHHAWWRRATYAQPRGPRAVDDRTTLLFALPDFRVLDVTPELDGGRRATVVSVAAEGGPCMWRAISVR